MIYFEIVNWVRYSLFAIGLSLLVNLAAAIPIAAQDRYASIIVDADTLAVLHARSIDAQRHPASLTKIMTLYLTFEALEQGQYRLDSDVKVSAHAARTPPVRMGLRAGQSVSLDTLIQAVAVRSSNDAAVVLAEAIAGSEEAFVDRMNQRARRLGMRNTVFRNPHGLPDEAQLTTARDMAKLAYATLDRFPQYYRYFGQSRFRGRENTNKLLTQRNDVDGFKTGFTRDSGYNLVISAVRDERRLIAVVLGGASSGSRNAHMDDLIERGFDVMEQETAIASSAQSSAPQLRTRPQSGFVQAATTQSTTLQSWAAEMGGFATPAEANIFADYMRRTVQAGTVIPMSIQRDNRAVHVARLENLTATQARQACAARNGFPGLPPTRCLVLSTAD